VTEDLQILWSLHGLDEQLVVLTTGLGRHPGERAALERRVAGERARLEAHRQELGEHQLRHRQLEKDIEALQVEERKFQGQLPLVKKNEEYQALLHEIADRKARRSDRETELLIMMEEEQRLGGQRPAIEQALKAVEAEAAARLAAIGEEEKRERDQVATLEAERTGLIEKLPAATRNRYERIRASRDGRAVVPILKGACGGCYRGQPPQVLQEARRGDRVLVCDGCGRMLIWPPEGA
jgi:predicted  nucleic acid-binding Zn-ribbon protein